MATTSPIQIASRRRWIQFGGLTLITAIAVIAGRDLAHHLPELESWVSAHGWLGPLVFLVAVVVFTSVLVPDTLLAAAAGVIFGVGSGTLIMIAASICTAALDFYISRFFLHGLVNKALSSRPRFAVIHRAVGTEGLQFQFLLRLTPINPVLLNYVLGTSKTSFPTYLIACAGMIPAMVVEVYFGHAAKHVAIVAGGVGTHSTMHTVLTVSGLVVCIGVLFYVTHIARKALANYEPMTGASAA